MKPKNKNIFRILEWVLFIVGAIFFCTYLTSCSTTKRRSTISEIFLKDSSQSVKLTDKQADTYTSRSIERKDTVVTFPFKFVSARFTPQQLQPTYTKEGKPQPQTYRIDTNGIRAIITAMIDGSINVTCEADSLKIVIASVLRINDSLIKNSSTTQQNSETNSTEKVISYSEFFIKSKQWIGTNFLWLIGGAAALYFINYITQKLSTRK